MNPRPPPPPPPNQLQQQQQVVPPPPIHPPPPQKTIAVPQSTTPGPMVSPQQPRPRMVKIARGPPRAAPPAPSQTTTLSGTTPRPRLSMMQVVRQKVPRQQAPQPPTPLSSSGRDPPPPPPSKDTTVRVVSPPPPPGARPPPPPPGSKAVSYSPFASSSGGVAQDNGGDTVAAALARIPSRASRMSILVAPTSEAPTSPPPPPAASAAGVTAEEVVIAVTSEDIPRVPDLKSSQDETFSISAISSDPNYEPSPSSSKAIGSWSTLASALSEIALSNKLREHLTELKDQVVQQAHEVAMRIHTVHEEETQRIIRQCLDDVGPMKKSTSMFEQDPFIKELSLQTEGKLTWDDLRQILSLRTMAFQQKKLVDIANKTERDFLLEKIEHVLATPTKLSFARSLESANQCLNQFYQGKEQLLLHHIAFYDEKINEFIQNAKRELSDVQTDISIHYQGYEKSKQAMIITYEQMKEQYQQAFTTLHIDTDEHWKLTSHLLDHILSWGNDKMKEIATAYHQNDELVKKRDVLFEKIDSLLMKCYENVYERIRQDDDYYSRSEQFLEKLNRYKRAVFTWKQQHSQSMEERLSYIQSVIDGYYMSIVEDLLEEKSELLHLHCRLEQYDMNLKHYLNEFFMRENNSRQKQRLMNNKSMTQQQQQQQMQGGRVVLEEIDMEALLRFQTFGPPNQRQNVLKLGTSLRAAANLAGLTKSETAQLMEDLLKASRQKAMYSKN